MQPPDAPHDALVQLMQRLGQRDRLRVSRVNQAWHRAALATLHKIQAKVDDRKAHWLHKWLKRNGGQVEGLTIRSCEPMELPEEMPWMIHDSNPVEQVSMWLPCASLPKLRMLRLFSAEVVFQGVSDATTDNPLPSLTSLKAYESPWICPYLHMLSSLKQLSLSDMDYPTGNLMRMATALTQLTRLRLEWTGDAAWEYKGFTHPHGFSRNERHYEPATTYCDEYDFEDSAASAFEEDVTFFFRAIHCRGLPALQELELGFYTSMRGEDTLNRRLTCGRVVAAPAPAQAAGGAAAAASSAGTSSGAAAPALPGLHTLKITSPLELNGNRNMLTPSLSTLTHLDVSLESMHSMDRSESMMLTLSLLPMRHQLAHLHLGDGTIPYGMPAESFRPFAALTALTHLALRSDAGPAGAMSEMFSGGPGSLARLKVFDCHLNLGFRQLGSEDDVRGLHDLRTMAVAAPNLEQLKLHSPFASGASGSAATECRALRSLTHLTSLTLYVSYKTGLLEGMFEDFASLAQLRQLVLNAYTPLSGQALPLALSSPRLSKLTALTNLQELQADPLIKVTPELPWSYPPAAGAAAGAPARPEASGADKGDDGDDDHPAAPQAALPLGVTLPQLLAEVAGSELLQAHAVHLIKSHKTPFLVKTQDPGW